MINPRQSVDRVRGPLGGLRTRAKSIHLQGPLGGLYPIRDHKAGAHSAALTRHAHPHKTTGIDVYPAIGDNSHMVTKRKHTMTEMLKAAIAESGISHRALEAATGVKRASIMRFMRGEQSLRLDLADRLAEYFGIECRRKGK